MTRYGLTPTETLRLTLWAAADAKDPLLPPARLAVLRRTAALDNLRRMHRAPVLQPYFSSDGRMHRRLVRLENALAALEQDLARCDAQAARLEQRLNSELQAVERERALALEGGDAPHIARLYDDRAAALQADYAGRALRLAGRKTTLEAARQRTLQKARSHFAVRRHHQLLVEAVYCAALLRRGGTPPEPELPSLWPAGQSPCPGGAEA